jgi:hypothetical protein
MQTPKSSTIDALIQNKDIVRCVRTCRSEPSNCDELMYELSSNGCGKSCSADSIGQILGAFSCVASPEMSNKTAWPGADAQKRVSALLRDDASVRRCTRACRLLDPPVDCEDAKQRLSPGGCGSSCSSKSANKLMTAFNCPTLTVD